ncbi:MAG: glycoside hydrolase family 15 protein [Acidiphilium sp.]
MSRPIEEYAMIGDGETAALVHRGGGIDWLCLPRFDSDACLAALLGDERHGSWLITPEHESEVELTRRYRKDTLVLETDFHTKAGAVRIVDFMPPRDRHPVVIRVVEGLEGRVRMRMAISLRFDYGSMPPWIEIDGNEAVAEVGPDQVVLRAPVPLAVEAGQRLAFSLSYADSTEPPPAAVDAMAALHATVSFWRDWIGRFTRDCEHPEAVRRSLITLKALIYRRTGGLAAAATTALPEIPGGAANWDYRFTWLRDSTFTLTAFLNAGYLEESRAWRDWILRAIAGDPDKMRIMYRIDGARHIPEWEVPWLPGHGWASPVRVGNAASTQHQADIYGEVIDAFHLAVRGGLDRSERTGRVERAIVEHIEKTWREPGAGLWESRGEPRHYVYARAMCWVGVDRFLKGCGETLDRPTRERFTRLRDAIHEEVCREGYHPGLGRFVAYYGGHAIDACLLLLPLIGFLPVEDPRIAATIEAVASELGEGGLVRRKEPASPTPEGTFTACACWLADCRAMQGRRDEARAIVARVLDIRNDVGLLAEEYNVPAGRLAGNFPQALSHLALVNTILGLSGAVLQRAGG